MRSIAATMEALNRLHEFSNVELGDLLEKSMFDVSCDPNDDAARLRLVDVVIVAGARLRGVLKR